MSKKGLMLAVRITKEEKSQAKNLAYSLGMTFEGWLGQLVKAALKNAKDVDCSSGIQKSFEESVR